MSFLPCVSRENSREGDIGGFFYHLAEFSLSSVSWVHARLAKTYKDTNGLRRND